jgi:hypothetical protein
MKQVTDFQRSIRCYIPEDRNFYNHRLEDFKSCFLSVNTRVAGDNDESTVVHVLITAEMHRELASAMRSLSQTLELPKDKQLELRKRWIRAVRVVASHCLDS